MISNGGKLWGWLLLQWLQTYHHLQVKFIMVVATMAANLPSFAS
jgi:hypothetical protein